MNRYIFAVAAAVALSMVFAPTPGFSQTAAAGKTESPGWFIAPPPEPGIRTGNLAGFDACTDAVVEYCTGLTARAAEACLRQNAAKLSAACTAELASPRMPQPVPGCRNSPVCNSRVPANREELERVLWDQTLGYTVEYPFELPPAGGGIAAVDVDSKGNLWAFQRNMEGKPQLFKFDANHKLILSVGADVIPYSYKPHGIKVDAEDNVWICDMIGSIVMKVSPDGKLLMTLGVRGERGDWVEEKGQRLLWSPVHLDFASNGDVYIFEGHANESPNDVGFSPTNNIGAARVIHLDKNGKYINQWYGNVLGPGKFAQTHGSAVDPTNGDVYIGDREEYRIVVYSAAGKFIKTIQMRNLVCSLAFDPQGNLWMGTGQDGQVLKIDREGNVLGAVGNGGGLGPGQFLEASYLGFDAQGNIYVSNTGDGRITKFVAPK